MAESQEASVWTPDAHAALTEWMQAYGGDVWAFVYAAVRRPDVADDLTQEVFIRAFTHVGAFRGDSSVKTWLFAIARNIVRDHARTAFVRRVTLLDNLEHLPARVDPTDSERAADIWDAALRLKPKYREVVVLRLREEMSFEEISAITRTSAGTARVRYQRALRQLKALLDARGGPSDGRP